jgi:hypothetical protein
MIRILYILISIVCLSVCNKSNAQYQTQAQDDLYLVPNPQTARWSYLEMDSTGLSTIQSDPLKEME